MRIIHFNTISFINKHLKDYPSPKNLGYFWNFRSLLGIALTIQILTGIFLAMYYYTPHINLTFLSVKLIMRDVQGGWFLCLHSNTASFYFFFIYLHILKALLFKSYHKQNKIHNFDNYIYLTFINVT